MQLLQTSEKKNGRSVRIFTITLSALETKRVLESPHFLMTPKATSGARFQIIDRGDLIDEKDLKFILSNDLEAYVMVMKTGFKSDGHHLEYLTKLDDIPMLGPSGGPPCFGYVRFRAA